MNAIDNSARLQIIGASVRDRFCLEMCLMVVGMRISPLGVSTVVIVKGCG